ncbi:hypothetical protein H632_c2167p0 [Helicosporidium sp. ATCC 50920]|nr:hypothetical protein H632_c2167p0 [Helicosporidium sp. ATCC 50920]|eukprot:KDD73449.1 hypothetical protein H632_c2167p0 [Helicosporidium sp. ATCC 50920]
MKKQLRLAYRTEKKIAKKLKDKESKAAKQELRQKEKSAFLAGLSAEELDRLRTEKAQRLQARRQEAEDRRARLEAGRREGLRIVLDLGFAELMTDSELKSLCQQLSYCHSANSRVREAAHLIFTGLRGPMGEALRRQCTGCDRWPVDQHEEDYLEVFEGRQDQLVYLTADSQHELRELDLDKAYIVGGIVDRNRFKRLCADKAEAQGIATARLPIGEYVQLAASPVMCTNHVVEIMMRYVELKDWKAAFETVIPFRKRKAIHRAAGEGGESEGDRHSDGGPDAETSDSAAAHVHLENAQASQALDNGQ